MSIESIEKKAEREKLATEVVLLALKAVKAFLEGKAKFEVSYSTVVSIRFTMDDAP